MALNVYTSTINYIGPHKLDISIKSGEKAFAPTWDMVRRYKNGDLCRAEYTEMYEAMLKQSMTDNLITWHDLLQRKIVVLCCYCKAGGFCHRNILSRVLGNIGCTEMGEITEDRIEKRPKSE